MPNSGHSSNRQKVDHTYYDYSGYLQRGGELVKQKKNGRNFPAKLHQMLSDPRFSHIIAWMPHGRAFKVLNKKLLTSEAIPAYFAQSKFESFTRQLSGWGYKRLYFSGADLGCYYHECFLRGMPNEVCLMNRVPPSQGKSVPNPEREPNFYNFSKLCPLPDTEDSLNLRAAMQAAASVLLPSSQTEPCIQKDCDGAQNTAMAVTQADSSASGKIALTSTLSMPKVLSNNELTSKSYVARDSAASLAASAEATTSTSSMMALCHGDSSSKPKAARRAVAASSMISASQQTPHVQSDGWGNPVQSARLASISLPHVHHHRTLRYASANGEPTTTTTTTTTTSSAACSRASLEAAAAAAATSMYCMPPVAQALLSSFKIPATSAPVSSQTSSQMSNTSQAASFLSDERRVPLGHSGLQLQEYDDHLHKCLNGEEPDGFDEDMNEFINNFQS